MGQRRPLLSLIWAFSNKKHNFYNKSKVKNVKSIQYTDPGFEPMNSQAWVVYHNTRPGLPPSLLDNLERRYYTGGDRIKI